MSDEQSEPKIIIDEDWKTQIQAEKEEAERKKQEGDQKREDDNDVKMPPASFPFLLTTLATQAMAALGQLPDPIEEKPVVRLSHAKHYIDTLGVLEEKTKGNLTREESDMLTSLLHQLRMAFVSVQSNPQAAIEVPPKPK
jgi:hypothetical protein